MVQANWNINDLQIFILMPIKPTSTLEGDIVIKITKANPHQVEKQTNTMQGVAPCQD